MNWLDFKLGGRMLLKYPGLTVIGSLAMAFAIWVGIVLFQFTMLFMYPSLPLSAADRIVEVRNWDVVANDREPRVLHDFVVWRQTFRSVTELGAWRDSSRNLIVADGDAGPVQVAEMSVSGFRVADGEPLLGRVLVPADEQAAASPVAVIGHDVWRTRFNSDPNVLGRTVQLGNEHVTVVGVMREGFAFPIAHDIWLPLRESLLDHAPRSGPAVYVFGVLAPGVTLQAAQAELTTLGRHAAVELPGTHEHLRPIVSSFARVFTPDASAEFAVMFSMYFFVGMLVVLMCGNVGLLLFARAATREKELIVRSALGATRSRIVGQLFAEALVLGLVAATLGLVAADVALWLWGTKFLEANLGRLPFWYDLSLSPAAVIVALGFTVLGAAVAGVVPALKITRHMGNRLKQTTAGGGGLQFGGVWTVVIVVQVAVTVAFPALVYWEQFQLRRVRNFDPGFAAEQYLTVRVERDYPVERGANADAATLERNARLASTLEEFGRRVAAQPGVAGVTFAERLPTTEHPSGIIEMSYDAATPPTAGSANARLPFREATIARVAPSYFEVLEAPMLAGRPFTSADARPGTRVAIVDQGFVDQVLQGRSAVGQQVRFTDGGFTGPDPWFEIVGVVRELGVGPSTGRRRAAGFYIPATPDLFDRIYMMVHVRDGDALRLAPELRNIATAVDPALRFVEFQRASDVSNAILWVLGVWLRITVVLSCVALVLSLAGIYAVLSFIVSRRTREIGVRVALGASPRRVVGTIFRRPALQVGFGILAGISLIFTVASLMKQTEFPGSESGLSPQAIAMTIAYAAVMVGVCMLACIVPTRRALAVEPTVALRAD